jgi:hypothetical protein
MTSYDQVWQTFLNNCKVSDIDLPQTPEKIYETIRNGVMHFNNRLREEVVCDDINETLDKELSNDLLLVLVHYIRLIFLINQKTYFESLWQPFSKDVGLKNFGTQLKSLETSVKEQQRTIDSLIMYMESDFL